MPSSLESVSPELPLTSDVSRARVPAAMFALTILLSAFLLFQIQPLIAKLILPWFGGSAAVWTSCMLFFQMALLGGYAYAHWLNGQRGPRQTWIHLGLLAISLLSLPIVPSAWWKPAGAEDPLLRILGLLAATVGLPYFLLSSTSPLLQTWYSRTKGGAMPYRFFALSNAGSMVGLLAYPVLVEPYLTGRVQAWTWSGCYAVFVAVCVLVGWRSRAAAGNPAEAAAESATLVPSLHDRMLWMGLAACASALLLAITNHLTQNVAAIPFLWVIPLSLYLLSFILCFDSDRWYDRWLFTGLGAIALGGTAYAMSARSDLSTLKPSIAVYCSAAFVLFMVCHGELARRRPAAKHLTAFYLMVSMGGAAGGLLIAFAAPYLFNALYDLPLVLSLTALVFLYLIWIDYKAAEQRHTATESRAAVVFSWQPTVILAALAATMGWGFFGLPGAATGFLSGAIFALTVTWIRKNLARATTPDTMRLISFATAAGLAFGLCGFLAKDTWNQLKHSRVLARNFYGALVVYDQETDGNMGPVRVLRHGTIDHGEQFLWPQNLRFPTTYYARKSGIGVAIQSLQLNGPLHVGVIGLGAGTLAAYGRPIDHYTFYDINPLVLKIANTEFRYLRDCFAPHEVIMGDARLSLEQGPRQDFDVLAVDAFSGDAIPVHLLTREAFALYWRHLKPDGILAVHVSNRYLRLGPVVDLGAGENHKVAKMISFEPDERNATEETQSDWVLVTSRKGYFDLPDLKEAYSLKTIDGLQMWTDDFSNLYKILR